MDEHRDYLGRLVREAWIKWALTQDSPKPSWLVSYDELAECDKEADRQIGEAIYEYAIDKPCVIVASQTDAYFFRCEECGMDACVGGVKSELEAKELMRQEGWEGKWLLRCPDCAEEFADERGALLENQ